MTVTPVARFEDLHHGHYGRLLPLIYGMPAQMNHFPLGETADRCFLAPFHVKRTLTLDRMAYTRGAGALAGGEQIRLGIYEDNGDTPTGGNLLRETGAVACVAPPQDTQEIPLTSTIQLQPDLYWAALIYDMATANLLSHYRDPYWAVNSVIEPCYYDAGAFAFTDPCPAITLAGFQLHVVFMRVSSMP